MFRFNKAAYKMLKDLEYIKAAEKITGLKNESAYRKALEMFVGNHWGLRTDVTMDMILDQLDSNCQLYHVGEYAPQYPDD